MRHQVGDAIHRLLYERLWARRINAIRAQGFVTFTFDDFPRSAFYTGGAILGDGRVGLILDLDRLHKDRNGDTKQ